MKWKRLSSRSLYLLTFTAVKRVQCLIFLFSKTKLRVGMLSHSNSKRHFVAKRNNNRVFLLSRIHWYRAEKWMCYMDISSAAEQTLRGPDLPAVLSSGSWAVGVSHEMISCRRRLNVHVCLSVFFCLSSTDVTLQLNFLGFFFFSPTLLEAAERIIW